MSIVMKIFALFAFALAALSFAVFICTRWRLKASELLSSQAESISNAADLIGVEFDRKTSLALSLAGPAVMLALYIMKGRRLKIIDASLPDFLAHIQGALKAGLSFPQALEMAAGEQAGPLGVELKRVVSELKLGRTVEEALAILVRRVPTDDVELIVQSIDVLRRTGGNLIETFATLAQTIEGRRRVEDRIRVLTSQGVYQCAILTSMPWILCMVLNIISPDYVAPLFATRAGLAMVIACAILEGIGALWLRSIVVIKV